MSAFTGARVPALAGFSRPSSRFEGAWKCSEHLAWNTRRRLKPGLQTLIPLTDGFNRTRFSCSNGFVAAEVTTLKSCENRSPKEQIRASLPRLLQFFTASDRRPRRPVQSGGISDFVLRISFVSRQSSFRLVLSTEPGGEPGGNMITDY